MTSLASLIGGGQIKSIQRGLISLAGVTSNTATVTAVVTGKALLSLLGHSHSSASAVDTPYLTLTNSTTITATRASTSGTATVSYQLVEYY